MSIEIEKRLNRMDALLTRSQRFVTDVDQFVDSVNQLLDTQQADDALLDETTLDTMLQEEHPMVDEVAEELTPEAIYDQIDIDELVNSIDLEDVLNTGVELQQ